MSDSTLQARRDWISVCLAFNKMDIERNRERKKAYYQDFVVEFKEFLKTHPNPFGPLEGTVDRASGDGGSCCEDISRDIRTAESQLKMLDEYIVAGHSRVNELEAKENADEAPLREAKLKLHKLEDLRNNSENHLKGLHKRQQDLLRQSRNS